MKILYLLNEGFDTPGPSNHLMKALIGDTLKSGIAVHLIESHRTGQNVDIPPEFLNYDNFTYEIIQRDMVPRNAFAYRYCEEVSYAYKCKKKWKHIENVDLYFVQSCPTAVFPISLLKREKSRRVLYSIQDMFPGSSIASGVMHNKLLQRFFYRIQIAAYKKADIITVISDDMKNKVVEQGVDASKIHIIVNWYDNTSVHEVPWDENRFVKKYNMTKDKYYIQYAGTMGFVFDYKMVIQVAELLKGYKDIVIQMIGQGSQKDNFVKMATEKHLTNIVFYPLEPQNMVSDVYSACSLCLIPLKRGVIGNSVPSKAGLLMACKRPIINSVDENSEYYKLFEQNNMGISASNLSPNEVTKAILMLYNDRDLAETMANNGYIYGTHQYSRSYNTKLFMDLYRNEVGEE